MPRVKVDGILAGIVAVALGVTRQAIQLRFRRAEALWRMPASVAGEGAR
jgi:hypothetical protein